MCLVELETQKRDLSPFPFISPQSLWQEGFTVTIKQPFATTASYIPNRCETTHVHSDI